MKRDLTDEEFKEAFQKRKVKLRKVFIEMLDYKQIKYSKHETFLSLLNKVKQHYHYYQYELRNTKEAVKNHRIKVRYDEEPYYLSYYHIIEQMDSLYRDLTREGENYQKHDVEFILEENETWEDLIHREQNKFIGLFHQMLDFAKVKYKKTDDYDALRDLVKEAYPNFTEDLYLLRTFDDNDIDLLLRLQSSYQYMEKNYKNYRK